MKQTQLDGRSEDIITKNIEQLKKIFPDIIVENKIDLNRLREYIGDYEEQDEKTYRFTWFGKNDAFRRSQIPSTGTLRPVIEESKDWHKTKNIYIEGENLEVLKLLKQSYGGKIKMIYIDPPYNKDKDFVYSDKWSDPIEEYKKITGQIDEEGNIKDSEIELEGGRHTNWLNMMYPRLQLARNLLQEDGAIFISIDDDEIENLKKICNEIFGEENFVVCFTWRRTDNQPNIGNVARVKEYILCYSKYIKKLKFGKLPLSEKAKNEYRYKDETGNFRRAILLDKTRGRHHYQIETPSGKVLNGPWMKKEEEFTKLDNEGGIYWTKGGEEQPYGKIYLHKSEGQIINDFLGIEYGTNQRASEEIEKLFGKRMFDFPKPTSLIETLIRIGAPEGGIILDFFAGSSTTAHSVINMQCKIKNQLNFILVQIPEKLNQKSVAFNSGYSNICEIGKERIRRAGEEILNNLKGKDRKQKTEQISMLSDSSTEKKYYENLDCGFKVFKLDNSNLKKWSLDVGEDFYYLSKEDQNSLLIERLGFEIDNFVEGRTELDIVYEVMLKYGIDLSYPVEAYEKNGKNIYSVGIGALLICMDEKINEILADDILEIINHLTPDVVRVVVRDLSFTDSPTKTNFIETLKLGVDAYFSQKDIKDDDEQFIFTTI